jgi:hypothetical protein
LDPLVVVYAHTSDAERESRGAFLWSLRVPLFGAVTAACAFVLFGAWLARLQRESNGIAGASYSRGLIFGVVLAAILGAGWPIANFFSQNADTSWREQLAQEAMLGAAGISPESLKALHGKPRRGHPGLPGRQAPASSAYLCWRSLSVCLSYDSAGRAGSLSCGLEPVGSKDESVAGDIYYDAFSEILTAFRRNQVITSGPKTDVWGTVTALRPFPSRW